MPNVSKGLGAQLRAPLTLLKRRLYAVLSQISPKFYESKRLEICVRVCIE